MKMGEQPTENPKSRQQKILSVHRCCTKGKPNSFDSLQKRLRLSSTTHCMFPATHGQTSFEIVFWCFFNDQNV